MMRGIINYGVHQLKGFVIGDDDHDDLASSADEVKHEYPNISNPWLALDQDICTPLYSNMSGINKMEAPPPEFVAPSSGLQWMQNGVVGVTAQNTTTIENPLKKKSMSLTLTSLELLTNHGRGMMNNIDPFLGININLLGNDQMIQPTSSKLSVADIVRIAGEKYVQLFTQKVGGFSMFTSNNSNNNGTTPELSPEETVDMELVQLLLAAAESVDHHQYDIASLLINRCQWVASESGNAVQRIIFYFAESLQCRIDMETGKTTPQRMYERAAYARKLEVGFNLSFLACHDVVPFNQTMQFASVQAILESVKTAKKIHVVDIHIRSGIQWTVLIQALAEREELPMLKISALATNNEQHMEETGNRLKSFAQSLDLDFTFNVVSVTEIKQLKEEMFKKERDEVVVVYSSVILRTMIPKPDCLAHLMKIIKRLKPLIVVVTEVEANHNSPSFVNRFTESLFFYGALFDCLEDCMERDDQHRKIIEGIYLGEGIRNIVGSEGDKRCTRNVKLEVWREFFAWYGMEEMAISDYAVHQANMVLNKFPKANTSCTITQNGKGIIIRWKGTPIHSVSVWKFV